MSWKDKLKGTFDNATAGLLNPKATEFSVKALRRSVVSVQTGGLSLVANSINDSKAQAARTVQAQSIAQQQEQKQAEVNKYQAMVDASYGAQVKKRQAGRPGTGLYSGASGAGGSGLYSV